VELAVFKAYQIFHAGAFGNSLGLGRRLIMTRSKTFSYVLSLAARRAQGHRISRIAPYGFTWKRRGRKMFMVEHLGEQSVMRRRIAELQADDYSINQIGQDVAEKRKVKRSNDQAFGRTELAQTAGRSAKLLRRANKSSATRQIASSARTT
jgi:hypothetical protein